MKRKSLIVVAVALLVAFVWGCDEDPICVDCCSGDCPGAYLPQTSPENVVNNLKASYQRREIEQYAKLLDPIFIFKFQRADIPADLPRDYWNRDEDSTGTEALFSATTAISTISVDLGAFNVEDAGRPDMPGAKRIRLTHAKLEVELFTGTTLLVQGDMQDMYFRQGSVEAGTDSTKWYLFEWQDVGGGGNLKPASGTKDHAPVLAKPSPLTEAMTWGNIKSRF